MRKLAAISIIGVLALLAAGCSDDDSSGNTGATSGPTTIEVDDVVRLTDNNGEVGCAIAKVGLGGAADTTLQLMTDCGEPIGSWEAIVKNGVISTDEAGEAQVRIDEDEICGLLYVFRNTDMLVSSCPNGSSASGCVQTGSVGFNSDCSGVLKVQTPSATVTLVGTWVAVSYVPETDLTLVTTFDGAVEIEPSDSRGEVTFIEAGTFYFTTRGDDIPELAGLPSREPLPIDALPGFVAAAQLGAEYVGVIDRAAIDGVLPPELGRVDYLNLRAGGELLTDSLVGDALLAGVRWESQLPLLVTGELGSAQALFGSEVGRNLLEIGYDPEFSLAVLEELGIFERLVAILYESRDAGAIDALLSNEDGLAPLIGNFVFEPVEAANSLDARAMYVSLLEEGLDVFWISRS